VREQRRADAAKRAYDLPNRLVAHFLMTAEPAPPAMRTSVSHPVYDPKGGQSAAGPLRGSGVMKIRAGRDKPFLS